MAVPQSLDEVGQAGPVGFGEEDGSPVAVVDGDRLGDGDQVTAGADQRGGDGYSPRPRGRVDIDYIIELAGAVMGGWGPLAWPL
ncbi:MULTISPECIES: hypothetical protein [unclassified Streptomyces]|uniref:hypothetical protein n=1 Tax=unclassified Streptomyces TaxID=2593676 RepID=UPI003647AEC3